MKSSWVKWLKAVPKKLGYLVLEVGGFKLIQIFVYSLSVVVFLQGLLYFSSKPSLKITSDVSAIASLGDVPIKSLLPFYKTYNFVVPSYVYNNQTYKNLFFNEREEDVAIDFTPLGLLEAITTHKGFKSLRSW